MDWELPDYKVPNADLRDSATIVDSVLDFCSQPFAAT